jgi:hypothetical protein
MKYILNILFFVLPFIAFSQNKNDCNNFHSGTFYYYPKNSNKEYISIRSENGFKEIETGKTDTSTWKVNWNQCTYEMKLGSGGDLSAADKQFLNEHKMVYKITGTAKDYYTFDGYTDNVNYLYLVKDTMWLQPQSKRVGRELFTTIANEPVIRKAKFSDTSAYAILYVYRSKKINQMRITYPVYLNENLMFLAQNGSNAIIKVLKEGTTSFSSRFEKNESNSNIDFKFGKKYYLKCDIHIGFYAKPELIVVNQEKGMEEFLDIY